MWLTYSDSEVGRFHPVCERALTQALRRIGKEAVYCVLHHQRTGTLEMDFAVQNRVTGKYLCVVEVKRTPADVQSTRYQFQAMSYVQMNAEQSERPFYILTNLECAFAFRYDAAKPRVFQQLLAPGLVHIGCFAQDTEAVFTEKLTQYFAVRLQEFLDDSYTHFVTLEAFAAHMERVKNEPARWKADLAALLYEYIRGAFDFVERRTLRDIRLFGGNTARICAEVARIDFERVFSDPDAQYAPAVRLDNALLASLYAFGNQNVGGDAVADLLQSLVSAGHEHDGEVSTDLELARLVAVLARHSSGPLAASELACDPAAGSGALLREAISVYDLLPEQLLANDVNGRLLEALALRIGLCYAATIGPGNAPVVLHENVAQLERAHFDAVRVVVMNPPFVAGIYCVERKRPLYARIRALTGHDAATERGQMPLEAVFLELVTALVRPGTTIACVLPKTHLTARGIEAQVIRRLLVEQFGLELVFTYPGGELFDDVTKDTCVVVGRVGTRPTQVQVVSSYANIPDLDTHAFAQALETELDTEFRSVMPGVAAGMVPAQALLNTAADGWRGMNSEMAEAHAFVQAQFQNEQFQPLAALGWPMKRGTAGNQGGSDLLFFDSRPALAAQFAAQPVALCAGMRNAKKLTQLDIGLGDSRFLNAADMPEALVDAVIAAYQTLPERTGRQLRREKSARELKEILWREGQAHFPAYSVLIPRGIRGAGKVYLSRVPVFVSTNFLVCTPPTPVQAVLLATWMSTVFYQLICEVSSKNQEGMRKMEALDIGRTYVPQFDGILPETVTALRAECAHVTFLNLRAPQARTVDRIWAGALFGTRADAVLDEAVRLLSYLAGQRDP